MWTFKRMINYEIMFNFWHFNYFSKWRHRYREQAHGDSEGRRVWDELGE